MKCKIDEFGNKVCTESTYVTSVVRMLVMVGYLLLGIMIGLLLLYLGALIAKYDHHIIMFLMPTL